MRRHRSLFTGIKLGLVVAIFLVSAIAAEPFKVQPASAQTGCPVGYTFYYPYGCVPSNNNGGCPFGQANYGLGCVAVQGNACPTGYYNFGSGCTPVSSSGCPYGYSNYGYGCVAGTGCTSYVNGVCAGNTGTCTSYVNGVCSSYGGCTSYVNGVCSSSTGCTSYVNGVCSSTSGCTSYVNGVCSSNSSCTYYSNGVCSSTGTGCSSYVNGYCVSSSSSCGYGQVVNAAGGCVSGAGTTTQLYTGCNEVITPPSLQGSSNVTSLISLVQPYGTVSAVWEFNNALHIQQAVYFAVAGAPTDTSSLNNSQSTFICVTGNGTFTSQG